MKNIGQVSYNINSNFTNYGSALQSWALSQCIDKIGAEYGFQSKLIDYCPKVLEDCDILNPFKRMWDTDDESRRMVELTMPAIKENYVKFENFYTNRFRRTKKKYHDTDFNDVVKDENVSGFVCGSDTIFCIDEFKGFVEGYYANFDCMKGHSVAYAASFGDSHFSEETLNTLSDRLKNFRGIGLRENLLLDYVKSHSNAPTQRVIDPTLLLTPEEYEPITAERIIQENYLLLYSRRYNKNMETFAEQLAKKRGLKIVEISLRATNAEKGHLMLYEAGVEEFLSLVKYAECVVTNSFHGIIMSVQFNKMFYGFSREQCDNKTHELTELMGLSDRMLVTGEEACSEWIDYTDVHCKIEKARKDSIAFLLKELEILSQITTKEKPAAPIVKADISVLAPSELLKGRKALITGGTSGIGLQIAKAYLNAGCEVLITGRNQQKIDGVCQLLKEEKPELKDVIHGLEMDVTLINNLDSKFQDVIKRMGGIDILVNNAGLEGGHINRCEEKDFDAIVDTNMKGVFFLSRIVARYMISNNIQGNILNICSSSSMRPANSAYTMSKWAVRGFTEGLARMLAPRGIVVNGIAPGMTATPMLKKTGSDDDLSLPRTLVGRYATPEEIANMAVILVSNMCRMVVGDILYMTGGSGNIFNGDVNFNFE